MRKAGQEMFTSHTHTHTHKKAPAAVMFWWQMNSGGVDKRETVSTAIAARTLWKEHVCV